MNQDPTQSPSQDSPYQAPGSTQQMTPMQNSRPDKSKRKLLIVVSILLVLVGGGVAIAAWTISGKPNAHTEQQAATTTTDEEALDSTAPSESATALVSIEDGGFSPDSMLVTPGTTVRWTNNDDKNHTVSGESIGSVNLLQAGAVLSYTYDQPGVYTVQDGANTMTVTVKE